MTRAARKREAREGRLLVLLQGASAMFRDIAQTVRGLHKLNEPQAQGLAVWRGGAQ
jgi:hypothetical protein